MPPANVVVSNSSSSSTKMHHNGDREHGSSSNSSLTEHHHDDVYFGGAKRPGVSVHDGGDARWQQESLLVQALQVPGLPPSQSHHPDGPYYDCSIAYLAQQQQRQSQPRHCYDSSCRADRHESSFERLTRPLPPPPDGNASTTMGVENSPKGQASLFNPLFPFQDQLQNSNCLQVPTQQQKQQRHSFSSVATKPVDNTNHDDHDDQFNYNLIYYDRSNNSGIDSGTPIPPTSSWHVHHQSSNSNNSADSNICNSTRSIVSNEGGAGSNMIIGNSVDTVLTSNMLQHRPSLRGSLRHVIASPPPELNASKQQQQLQPQQQQQQCNNSRRNVFGGRVQQKYQPHRQAPMHPQHYYHQHYHDSLMDDNSDQYLHDIPFYNIIENEQQQQIMQRLEQPPPDDFHMLDETNTSASAVAWNSAINDNNTDNHHASTPPQSPQHRTVVMDARDPLDMVSPLKSPTLNYNTLSTQTTTSHASRSPTKKKKSTALPRRRRIHETVHAQSLLLGFCFMAIWSPSNVMAPNLTQMAEYYGMTEQERDLYLGSFLALATGVLSFPLSALIGFGTDLYSRKYLFVGTALGGALASTACGMAPNYACLVTARFLSGGFMSASVSIAFSFLGDLFAVEERNAASSGLTAMMGSGIILGQVYAGTVGNRQGWQHAFYVSSIVTALSGLAVALLVQEPVRGGKEKVLQEMLKQGKQYDRKLTWKGFCHAMQENQSNGLLMVQAFFGSLPWGIIFVFLNDYLSQERGFSVPDATFIVLLFGIGCALGGIMGGYFGSMFQNMDRRFLPLFMAATTVLAILPFLGLLNGHTTNAHGVWASMYSITGGMIASMPSVNVRPCLINVNPPETRGASLTANNLIVQLARGIGPSFITIMGSTFHVSRQVSFNATLSSFWAFSSIQLVMLARSLPRDQDKMEAELAQYAARALAKDSQQDHDLSVTESFQDEPERPESTKSIFADDETLVSIEDRMISFDAKAVKESLAFIRKGVKELELGSKLCRLPSLPCSEPDEDDDDEDGGHGNPGPTSDLYRKRDAWFKSQQRLAAQTIQDDEEDEALLSSSAAAARSKDVDASFPDETTRLV